MENYLSLSPNNGSVRVTIESLGVIPGLGRHRLQILTKVNGEERTDGAVVTFSGDVSVEGLGGAQGYLGSILPTTPQRINRDGSFQVVFYVELTDDQIRKIEGHRTRGDGGFDLRLNVRVDARYPDGTRGSGSNQFNQEKFSREDWLNALFQLGVRKVMISELDVPDAASNPERAKALEYFSAAQNQFAAGEYRLTAECLRQCLNVLVGKAAEEESDAEEVTTDMKTVIGSVRNGEKVTYLARMELARSALKFMADLGAHPEIDDTSRTAAEAQLHMTAGLLYWYNRN